MLDENWSDRLAGMRIIPDERQAHASVTCLVGHLRDQAQLSGVLNTLYELHLPILLARYIPPNDKGNDGLYSRCGFWQSAAACRPPIF